MPGRPKGSKNIFPPDLQRERLYRAEKRVSVWKNRDFESKEEAERFIRKVMRRKMWTDKSRVRGLYVRSTSKFWATTCVYGGVAELNLPPWAWNKLIIAHELAHVLCEPIFAGRKNARAIHSREFAGAYLYLVGKLCGSAVKEELKEQFLKAGVEWT